MTSTLQLVERLKAQLAESRADLCSKDHALEEFASSARSEASEAPVLPKEGGGATRDSDSISSCSRSKSEHLQAQVTALQEELRQKSGSLAAKMVGIVTSTKGLSQQLILERQQRLAFEQEVRALVEAKPLVQAQAFSLWDLQQLKQDVHVLSARTQRTEEQLEASIKAVLAQLGINEHVPHALALPKQAALAHAPMPCSAPRFGPECLPAFQDHRLRRCPSGEAPFERSLHQLKEEVEEIQKHSEFMQRNLEAAIEAVSCQLSSVTAWVQQNFGYCFSSHGAWPQHATVQDVSAVAARFPQLSPILEDRCVGEDAAAKKGQDGLAEEFSEDLLPFLRLLVDDVPQMVKRMTENSQTLLEKINLERADRLACEAQIGEALKQLDERVDSFTSRPPSGPTLLHNVQNGVIFDDKGRIATALASRPVAVQRCASAPLGLAVAGKAPCLSVTTPGLPHGGGSKEKPERLTPRDAAAKAVN